jgi:hypothetical protein
MIFGLLRKSLLFWILARVLADFELRVPEWASKRIGVEPVSIEQLEQHGQLQTVIVPAIDSYLPKKKKPNLSIQSGRKNPSRIILVPHQHIGKDTPIQMEVLTR